MLIKFKKQKGVSLFLALVVMTVFLSMGAGLGVVLIKQKKSIQGMDSSVVSFYAADSGIEKVFYLDSVGEPTDSVEGILGSVDARFKASLESDCSLKTVTSHGYSDTYGATTRRSIEVSVEELPYTTNPVITLLGDDPVNLNVGDSYTDAGATALDCVDGDITADIVVGGDTVDTSIVGTYIITYNVLNTAGNPADEVTRTVNTESYCSVVDTGWGDNLYGCMGADYRCYNGSCVQCGGWVYDDGCSGCAGQGGDACWYDGWAWGSSGCNGCTHGCVAADWNDDSSCTVKVHYSPGGCYNGCWDISWSHTPSFWHTSGNCGYRDLGRPQDCGAYVDPWNRVCVCNY